MFSINFIIADDVLETTGLTQQQLDAVIAGVEQAAELWSRYIDGNNAVIDIALDFSDLSGSTLAQAGSSFFSRNNGPFESEVITELNGGAGVFAQDGTFTVDLPSVLNDRFYYSDSLDFVENPGAQGQIDFLTLAAHELGHVLGYLGLSFEGFVENNQFVGANAVAANGGNPVDLADGVHTAGGDLLSPSISSNLREPLTPVLIAILKDIGITLVEATSQADTLYGYNQHNDNINGEGGNDILNGLGGDDTLFGLSGDDTLNGGEGADIIDGGSGVDTADYSGSSAGVVVYTSGRSGRNGDAQDDRLTDVENIIGSDQQDQIVLDSDTAVDNVVNAGDGDDRIRDRDDGDNTFNAEDGDDRVFSGSGNDIINGGDGLDDLYGGGGNDIINGGDDNSRDRLFGSSGDDELFGGGGNDALRGNTGEDMLFGGDGTDNLDGGNQDDFLDGGAGVDTLIGGGGNDTLIGGTGSDLMSGGSGDDLFIFEDGSGIDRITDFNTGAGDQIDLIDFGFADFDAVMALAFELNGDVRIQLDTDDRLILEDITLDSLDASDFILA